MKAQTLFRTALAVIISLFLGVFAFGQDSLNVKKVGQFSASWNYAHDVKVAGSYAYLVDLDSSLHVINVTNPTNPSEVGCYNAPGSTWDVAVSGSYAYVATDLQGLRIVDISTPSEPREVGHHVSGGGNAHGVAVSGSYAYLANGSELQVVDISTPSAPFMRDWCFLYCSNIAVVGSYAYTTGMGYFNVVNISNPDSIYEVGYCNTLGSSYDLAVSENYAYIAAGEFYDLIVVNISHPDNPQIVGSFYFPSWGYASGVAISVSFVFVADGSAGLRVLNISNPSAPQEDGYYDFLGSGYARGVDISGIYAYVAEGDTFSIYDCSQAQPVNPFTEIQKPAAFSLSPPYPNPFNQTTMLTFSLPHPAKVSLEVFDINGRCVGQPSVVASAGGKQGRLPYQEMFDAGTHTIPFDGTGLPSGIYLARLTAGEYSAVQKLVLLK